MKKQSDLESNLRNQILGFGEKSSKKSYYPELQQKVTELNRLRSLIDKIDTAVVLVEVDSGNILDFNKSANQLFKCEKIKERSGNFLTENFPNLDLTSEEKIKKDLAHLKLEINGEYRYFDIKTEFEKTENNLLLLMLYNDVTQRVNTQNQLAKNESNLRALIDNLSDSFWSIDSEYKIIAFNKTFQKQYKLSTGSELYLGLNIIDINKNLEKQYKSAGETNPYLKFNNRNKISPDMDKLWKTRYDKVLETGEPQVLNEEYIFNDKKIYAEISMNPIIYKEKIIGVTVYAKDITQQKEAEIILIESETRFRIMIEDAPIGAVISDNFKITYVNRATLELFKSKNQNDFLNKDIREFVASESMNYLSEILEKRNLGLLELNRIELKGRRINDDVFDLLVNLTNINIGEEKSTLLFLYDVSKQKNIERYLQKAKETAEKSEKLKTEFLAQISHEIRTPINTILSFVSLLKEEFPDDQIGEYQEGFTIIRSAGQRIIRTVDLILNMAEIQTGTYEPNVKTVHIIADVILPLYAEYKSLAKSKNLELLFENRSQFEEIEIDLDEYTFSQIISNLVDNAIKYTHEGSVKIKIEDEANNKFSFHICDTGIGISEEYLPHLFDAFSQEDMGYTRRFEGNGLGLALVKEYCKISNLEIKVQSKKNFGTTFSIYPANF